jgi:hypothetical protein
VDVDVTEHLTSLVGWGAVLWGWGGGGCGCSVTGNWG